MGDLLLDHGRPVLPTGYTYYCYFDGQQTMVINNNQPIDIKRRDSEYLNVIPSPEQFTDTPESMINVRVVMAVRDTILANPYSRSNYYYEQQLFSIIPRVAFVFALVGIIMLVYVIIRRKDKHAFDRKLAFCFGKVWLEIKILISILTFAILGSIFLHVIPNISDPFIRITNLTFFNIASLLIFWWFYLITVDLIINRKSFFTHNFINCILKQYMASETKYSYSWQKPMLKRAYALIAAEAVLFVMFMYYYDLPVIALLTAGCGIYLIYRSFHHFSQTVDDIGKLLNYIELIKNGDLET